MNEKFYQDYKEKGVTREMVDALEGRLERLFDDAINAAESGQPYAMAVRLGEAKHALEQFKIFTDELLGPVKK